MTSAYTYSYNRTNSVTFLGDSMRNALRDVIREHGLDPHQLMVEWDQWIKFGVAAWLESGHLRTIHIEFYLPGASSIMARWDFPMSYDGSGVDEDMWLDKTYLRQLIAKSRKPAPNLPVPYSPVARPRRARCGPGQHLLPRHRSAFHTARRHDRRHPAHHGRGFLLDLDHAHDDGGFRQVSAET